MSSPTTDYSQINSAIRGFLDACQKEASIPLAEALGAIRRMFRPLKVSDAVLLDALAKKASEAGFEVQFDAERERILLKRQRLEEWDNEGGAPYRSPAFQARSVQSARQVKNDSNGIRRRDRETKQRNDLI